MKRLRSYLKHHHQQNPYLLERKWIFPLTMGSVVCLFLLLLFTTLTSPDGISLFRSSATSSAVFVESKLHPLPISSLPHPPRFAYLISGSIGDGVMLKRTLQALYHPVNQYIVHLDLESPPQERRDLQEFVANHSVFKHVGNVRMITMANLVTYRGPTMVANTLHAAAILLKESGDWDWFINLSATDYPLVTQDDLLHAFSYLPRDLNFIDHTSNIGWKEVQRAKPVIVDPGLYMTKKADVFWITQRRSIPTAFKLFTVYVISHKYPVAQPINWSSWWLYKEVLGGVCHLCSLCSDVEESHRQSSDALHLHPNKMFLFCLIKRTFVGYSQSITQMKVLLSVQHKRWLNCRI